MLETAIRVGKAPLADGLRAFLDDATVRLTEKKRTRYTTLLAELDKAQLWQDVGSIVKVLQPLLRLHAQLCVVCVCLNCFFFLHLQLPTGVETYLRNCVAHFQPDRHQAYSASGSRHAHHDRHAHCNVERNQRSPGAVCGH